MSVIHIAARPTTFAPATMLCIFGVAMLFGCGPGPDSRFAPPGPPPPRADTLPTEYVSVGEFCRPPEDPTALPAPTRETARALQIGAEERVQNMENKKFTVPLRCIVRSQKELEQLWEFSRDSTPPAIDFSEQMLVVATAGQRSSGGFGIGIDAAWHRGDTLIVLVTERLVGHGCAATMEVVYPADAMRAPVVAAVRFQETISSGEDCL